MLTPKPIYTLFIFEDDNNYHNSYWVEKWHSKKVIPRLDRIKRLFKFQYIRQQKRKK